LPVVVVQRFQDKRPHKKFERCHFYPVTVFFEFQLKELFFLSSAGKIRNKTISKANYKRVQNIRFLDVYKSVTDSIPA